jgi:outer membrane putative beta-barrel porin/alpha-amylase
VNWYLPGQLLILLVGAASLSFALVGDLPDKNRYNLFNPTPKDLLREFATDRPDKTEGPTTVDAGHFQFEMDLATFTHDTGTKVWNVAPFNLRAGLLNQVELSLIFGSYVNEQSISTLSGVGDFITRLKINLWGNDRGPTAFAFLPFVKFPTNTGGFGNDAVEGGSLFPFSVNLPGQIEMGMETGVSFLRNEIGRSYHEEFVNSVTFAREIVARLRAYCEFFSSVSTERNSDWVGTVDLGVTFAMTEDLQLDCGCNIGVTRGATNTNAFSGLSFRF